VATRFTSSSARNPEKQRGSFGAQVPSTPLIPPTRVRLSLSFLLRSYAEEPSLSIDVSRSFPHGYFSSVCPPFPFFFSSNKSLKFCTPTRESYLVCSAPPLFLSQSLMSHCVPWSDAICECGVALLIFRPQPNFPPSFWTSCSSLPSSLLRIASIRSSMHLCAPHPPKKKSETHFPLMLLSMASLVFCTCLKGLTLSLEVLSVAAPSAAVRSVHCLAGGLF